MTAKINPHKGRYAELLLSGEKPVAMLEIFDAGFEDTLHAVEQGKIKSISTNVAGSERLFFCLPGNEDDMHELAKMYKQFDYTCLVLNKKPFLTTEQHRRIGQILGYTPEDIEAFIKQIRPEEANPEP